MHREIERLEPREGRAHHAAAARTHHAELAQHLAEVDQLEGLERLLVLTWLGVGLGLGLGLGLGSGLGLGLGRRTAPPQRLGYPYYHYY